MVVTLQRVAVRAWGLGMSGTGKTSRARSPRTSLRQRAPDNGRAQTREARGGLTAAGRRELKRAEEAARKPGGKKATRDMTSQERRRKGSGAVRFDGPRTPPLLDDNAMPTRFALTAAAWGGPAPTTHAAAPKIAAKGRRLLAQVTRARRQQQ